MKIYNKTTGRFYLGFSSKFSQPLWSQPHRPSQALEVFPDEAERIVKQLTALEPALDLIITN